MSSVDTQCHSKEFLSTAFITGFSSPYQMVLNFIWSPTDIHTVTGLLSVFLFYGQLLSSAIISVMLYWPVSDELRKRVINMKMHQKREEFHTDGDLVMYHVPTISGKPLDGFYSQSWQGHGLLTYSQFYQSIKWQSGPLRNTEPTRNNLLTNILKEERPSSLSLFDA